MFLIFRLEFYVCFHLTFNCTLEFFQLEKCGNMWNNDGKIFCGNLSIIE